jgi:RNA polymerase sigma factor (sigma-70 family)
MPHKSHEEFALLVAPHIEALYRMAYRLTGQRSDAEDLVQDVCVRAYAHLAELTALEQPKSWLLRIQYRLFVDGARRRKRSPLETTDKDLDAETPSANPTPDEAVEGTLVERRVLAALAHLENEQRALLALQVEGYSLDELHVMTDLSKNVLKARLYRARVRLGTLLERDAVRPALAMEG